MEVDLLWIKFSDRSLSFVPICYSPKSKLPAVQQHNTSKARKRKLLPELVGKPARAQSPLERDSIYSFSFGKKAHKLQSMHNGNPF